MLEVLIKQQLAGYFSAGMDDAPSRSVRSELPVGHTAQREGSLPPEAAAGRAAEEIVMRKWNAERGMSLVEATIILMVLATLTAVISPSIADYANDAESVKAREDVEAIGTGVLRLLRDTGSRCLRLAGTTDCTKANRVDLLISAGTDPRADNSATVALDADAATTASVSWLPTAAPAQQDTIDDQLIENDNATAYTAAGFTGGGGPRMKIGWRGAYLNGPVNGDPWGNKYQANTIFLAVATDAADGAAVSDTTEGLKQAGWQRNVLVLSAGANAIVETEFGGSAAGAGGVGVTAGGDDVIYVLRGSTR
jgi:type II secretory pathway pseudopilin PulG